MDIFVLRNPTATMKLEDGEIINGLTNKMWIERYDEAGEFTLVGPVSGGYREKLPIGSMISHTNTREVMIVENHEINDQEDQESIITITGRGWETYFEQRIVGAVGTFPKSSNDLKFLLPEQHIWDQIVQLVNQHFHPAFVTDDTNGISFFQIDAGTPIVVPGSEITSRRIEQRDVYSAVVELLKTDNLGIKVIRPGIWSPLGAASPNLLVRVHRGVNRSAHITFSYDTGDIINADYLWSNKKLKTSALVTGRYIQTIVHLPGFAHYDRRMMAIDASDVDDYFDTAPDPVAFPYIVDTVAHQMRQKGLETLKNQKDVNLTKAETSKRTVDSRFRLDYDVGDLVTVVGDYNENSIMRISEFVEIDDENGSVAYPTLNLLNQES